MCLRLPPRSVVQIVYYTVAAVNIIHDIVYAEYTPNNCITIHAYGKRKKKNSRANIVVNIYVLYIMFGAVVV